MKSRTLLVTLALASLATFGAACEGGEPTGATCPDGSTLTYASFGEQFMADYCVMCHSSTAEDRHGAPKSANFDTIEEIRAKADDIDSAAGKGPSASNDWMPDSASVAFPTATEREQLAEWLACGAP